MNVSSLMEVSKVNPLSGPQQQLAYKKNQQEHQGLVQGRNIVAADALPGGKF